MGIIYRNGIPYGVGDVEVPETVPTLSWGSTKTIGTVSGKDFKVTMPSNPDTTYSFTSGTNSFQVTSNGNTTTVNVTPSITNNITGTGTNGKVPKFTGTNTIGNGYSVDTTVTENSTNLITSGAVSTAISNLPEPMIFKGTLGTGGTITSLPTASSSNEGYTYKVITAGTYASTAAKVGDVFISAKPEGASSYSWVLIPAGDTDTDTWRSIKINGTATLGSGISTGTLDFVDGNNTKVDWDDHGHELSINATVPCAYCDTAAGTAAKTATCTDYTLLSKSYLHVLIKNANTSANALTLSVNGQTAKGICINGVASSSSNYTLPAGTYLVYYDGTNYHFRTDGKVVTVGIVNNAGNSIYANSSHSHGNIQSGGTLQTDDVIINSGDKLVITDSSNSDKVARASLSFDGATTTKCLTQAGTWASFASSDSDTIPSAYCATVASGQYKFAQCTDYSLLSKSYIQVIIKNTNTYAGKIYLAIGHDGLQSYKAIYINGTVSSSTNYTLPEGSYLVYYDGTYYYFRTDGKITGVGLVNTSNNEIYTSNTGTVTGTGTSNKLAKWNGTSSITDGPGITDNSSSTAVTSTDTNLITGRTLYYAGYTKNTGTVTGSSLTADNIITGNGSTAIKSSGKTIATSISAVDTAVPTSNAVKTYADSINALTALCSTAAATDVKTISSVGPYTDFDSIPAGTTIHVMFENGNSASPIGLKIGSSTGKNIYPAYNFPAGTILSLTKTKSDSSSSTSTVWHVNTSTNYIANRVDMNNCGSTNYSYPIGICSGYSGDQKLGGTRNFTYNPSTHTIRVGGITPEDGLTQMSISGGNNGTMSISGEKGLTITGATSNSGTGIQITDASPVGIEINASSTTTGAALKLTGERNIIIKGNYTNWGTGSGTAAYISTTGYIVKYSSSQRYKEKINYDLNLNNYHNQLMQLKPCTFEYKTEPGALQLGMIAEDVEQINPNLCVYDGDLVDGFKDRDILTMLIIEAQKKDQQIQSLQSEIELLKQRLDNLES